jgi:ribonucleoside-diphosphate reductase alpha chain
MNEGKSVDHFVGSQDLSVEDHMKVQAIVQSHVDNAVSKTINMDFNYPIEDMSRMWLDYLPKLKGTTFYRENTRGFVNADGSIAEPPLKAISIDEAKKRYTEAHKIESAFVDDCVSGVCSV